MTGKVVVAALVAATLALMSLTGLGHGDADEARFTEYQLTHLQGE